MTFISLRRYVVRIVTLVCAVVSVQCGSNSPSSPSPNGVTLSGVSLAAASVAAGSTAGGTVTLTAPAPAGGVSVALSSSNSAVASVQTPVTIAAGEASAPITITGVAAGTATIAASLNGTTRQSSMLTVTARAALVLTSVSLSPTTVVGGESVRGTVVLNDRAPAAGATVSLAAGDPVTVPSTVVVPAGSATATFTATTKPVGNAVTVNIQASFGGAVAGASLAVTPPSAATARFGVSGPTETETCTLADNGAALNCTFNGTTSTAPGRITAWDWSYGLDTRLTQTTSGPVLSTPAFNCQMLPKTLPAGMQWFTMSVELIVHDDRGNVSPQAVNAGIRLIPTGACGF